MSTKHAHIANTCFEETLFTNESLSTSLLSNNATKQLQWLPYLYKNDGDVVIIASQDADFSEYRNCTIIPWGMTDQIREFAANNKLTIDPLYTSIPQDMLSLIASKEFVAETIHHKSYEVAHTQQDIYSLLKKMALPLLFRATYSCAGKGHLVVNKETHQRKIDVFCDTVFSKSKSVIVSPYYNRVFDMSTQVYITQSSIQHIGATVMDISPTGKYKGSRLLNSLDRAFYGEFLDADYSNCMNVAKKLQLLGMRGHCGFDSFIYKENNQCFLHSICEINPRKTMGVVALNVLNHHTKTEKHWMRYRRSATGLLPSKQELCHDIPTKFPFNITISPS